MKIIILHNDSCYFQLKNGKEILLKGHHEINQLNDDDFNDLLLEYPHIKLWEEKGFITFDDKKQDNLEADNTLKEEKAEEKRSEDAVKEATDTVAKAKNGK